MKKQNIATAAVISGIIAMGASLITAPALAAGDKEKCYGVAAAGKNDCATKMGSCAGTSKMDHQADAFLAVPKGMCGKLAGGSLTPKS
ncbi:MAG: DUF2282 domain-containing protein [Motiliproteus sp.]